MPAFAEDGGGLRMSADARALLMQRLAGESLPAPPPLPGTAGAPGGVTPPQQVRNKGLRSVTLRLILTLRHTLDKLT